LHEAVYDQPEPTCWSIARVRLHAVRVLLCSECCRACAGHHSWAFVSGVRRSIKPSSQLASTMHAYVYVYMNKPKSSGSAHASK
jgi:hypothetical protein